MKYEEYCKHFWYRKWACTNKDLIKNEENIKCPYGGLSEITILGHKTPIKCSKFTPKELWCPNCETWYKDGTKHKCGVN